MSGLQLRETLIERSAQYWQSYFYYSTFRGPDTQDLEMDDRIREFSSAFKKSQIASIDRFLFLRPEFSIIGKICIFLALLNAEHHSPSQADNIRKIDGGDWLFWLYNRYISMEPDIELRIQQLNDLPFRFLTFNYDRFLEFFFCESLMNSTSQGNKQAIMQEAIRNFPFMNIRHVYGKLSRLPELSPEPYSLPYGGIPKSNLKQYLNNIQLIGERGSHDREDVSTLFSWAERIFFLGFGFDDENIKTLAFDQNLKNDGSHEIFATCKGISAKDRSAIMQKICASGFPRRAVHLRDMSIMDLLVQNL